MIKSARRIDAEPITHPLLGRRRAFHCRTGNGKRPGQLSGWRSAGEGLYRQRKTAGGAHRADQDHILRLAAMGALRAAGGLLPPVGQDAQTPRAGLLCCSHRQSRRWQGPRGQSPRRGALRPWTYRRPAADGGCFPCRPPRFCLHGRADAPDGHRGVGILDVRVGGNGGDGGRAGGHADHGEGGEGWPECRWR